MGGFMPREKVERPADKAVRRANLRRIGRLFRGYWGKLSIVTFLIVVASALGVIPAFLLRDLISNAFQPAPGGHVTVDFRLLTELVIAMIAISLATGVIGVIQAYLSTQVGQSVMHDLRTAVYRHLQRLSLSFFTKTRTGEVQSRIANDIGGVDNVLTSTATSIMSTITTVVATVVAMFLLSWQLACIALALMPIFVVITRKVGAARRKIATKRQESMADMSSLVQESLSVSGILLGKTMGRSAELAERFEGESNRLADLEVRSRMTGRWLMQSIQMTFAIMPALIYWFGGLGGRALGRHRLLRRGGDARLVHHPPDPPVRADREPAQHLGRRPDLAGALRPDLRVPRPADRHRAGQADARAGPRGGAARRRVVPLRRRRRTRSRPSRSPCRRGRRPRSSARPARERRRSGTSCHASTTRRRGG